MSEVPSKGQRTGRNTTHTGRGGRFRGRITQRGARGRPDAQTGEGLGTHGGIPYSWRIDRNENGSENNRESRRGWRRESSSRMRVSTNNRNIDRNKSDNGSERGHDSSQSVRGLSWRSREPGWQRERSNGRWRVRGTSESSTIDRNDRDNESERGHDLRQSVQELSWRSREPGWQGERSNGRRRVRGTSESSTIDRNDRDNESERGNDSSQCVQELSWRSREPGWQKERSNGRRRVRGTSESSTIDRNDRDNESERGHDSSQSVRELSWRSREPGWQKERSSARWHVESTLRGGKSNNNDSNTGQQLDCESLLQMLKKDPDELVTDLTSDSYLPAFESLLNQSGLPDKDVIVVLKVFARACDSETSQACLIILLNKLISSVYLSSALTRYINCLAFASIDEERDLEDELKFMVKLFFEVLEKLPTSFSRLPLPNLLHTATVLTDNGQIRNAKIKSSVENLMALRDEKAKKVQKGEEEVKKTKQRIDPGNEVALLDNEDPPDDYRLLNVFPGQDDIHPNGPVFVRRNKVEGSYDGPEHYLDVQFRLLREDFIRPLREGIAALCEGTGIGAAKPSQDIRVYNGVRLLEPVCNSKGVTYEISFDVSRLKRIQWENSKRLIYGSLLCLSKDNFETFFLATVEERNPVHLEKGKLQVRFTDINADLGYASYQMVETSAYFEAYRHVLEGLQKIGPFRFPFERYIVKSEPDVAAPLYLLNTSREVVYDLTCIMTSNSDTSTRSELYQHPKHKGHSVNILDLNSWPTADDLGLDSSQLKAVQLALTKEFAIIQGPPGTGKTYIGLKVAKVLLNNKMYWNPLNLEKEPTFCWRRPILLVCYTNHALDQFLEGIYKFHPEGIVRVGGQSQSSVLEECNIRNIKEKIRRYHRRVCLYYRRHRERQQELGWHYWYHDSDSEGEDSEEGLKFPEINSELKEIYDSQEWIRFQFKDLYEQLKSLALNLRKINYLTQKLKATVMDEKKLLSERIISEDIYDSIVSRFKKIKVKPDVMHYWLGLLSNTMDFIKSGSTFVSPVAVYPLSRAKSIDVLNSSGELVFRKVKPAKGIDGGFNGSYEIAGKHSYIRIPNMENSLIDTRYSMTILLYVSPNPFGFGPIITFHQGSVIGIQIEIQKSAQNFRGGVLSVTFNRRDGVHFKPLVTNETIEWDEWNYIAASYDYHSGILRVYHNGNMVGEQQNPSMEIASDLPVDIGCLGLPNKKEPSFRGRVSFLQFFSEAISQEQIRAIAGIPEEDVIEAEEKVFEEAKEEKLATDKPRHNIVFEGDAMEELRKLDVDDIDEDLHLDQRPRQNDPLSYQEIAPCEGNDKDNEGEWEMQCPKFVGSRAKRILKKEMEKTVMMTSDEANKVTDVWKLSRQDKWRLYRYWAERMREMYRIKARSIYPEFEECAEGIKSLQLQEYMTILQRATIIGMTTTGAAKFRKLIQEIHPRITIVEEAAEVLESHIVTSLSPGCEHLILIGDHKQLRPSPNVYALAKDYNLDVSLFERMVNNGMEYQTLRKQHRMRPEIAQMMKPIYEDLENNESVLNFENIKGVNKNIFFVEHNELEDFVDEGKSRSNIHEARYLAALCRYFILQGYDQSKITILTMYVGQLRQLQNETEDEIFQRVHICAVDNFQGEENDIILLSLVRSNEEGNIGFLRISNRVCVALSRARKGFYCIGNLELMCRKEKLWATIVKDMRERGNVGHSLTLMCQNHPSTKIHASTAADFQRAPQGGCRLPCHARLDCGHACRLSCHPGDPSHTEYQCLEPCTKTLCDLGHMCKKRCYQECGLCEFSMEKIMPICNHTQVLQCSVDPASTECKISCEVLKCGHQCSGNCSKCKQGRLHQRCEQKCEQTLVCGHKCLEICAIKCPSCPRDCENECVHKKCNKKCGEHCYPCIMPCAWQCEHLQCTRQCGKPCNRPRCNEPCKKTLPCGHQCIGICGEPCPKICRVCDDEFDKDVFGNTDDPDARFVLLQPCGHVIEVNSMDEKMDKCCNYGSEKKNIQLKRCPVCDGSIRTCPRYANIIKAELQDIEKIKKLFVAKPFQVKARFVTRNLSSRISLSGKFKKSSKKIPKKLKIEDLYDGTFVMNSNQRKFWSLLDRMLEEIATFRLYEDDPVQAELKESLENEILTLHARGTENDCQFSDQEIEDIRDEILRVQLMVSYKLLIILIQEGELILEESDVDDLDLIGQAIDSRRRIDGETLDSHLEFLDQIRASYDMWTPCEGVPIKREDTMEISNSIGYTQDT